MTYPTVEMSLNEYQRQSMATAPGGVTVWETEMAVAGLGLAGEAGEVADHIKKVIGHGHALDREYIKKELGDVLWYIQYEASLIGYTLEEVAQANIDKLKARYPEGFSREASINRAQEDK
jgi:NTP pyrophosphatase (non-canonical NTP hydrolase)